MAKKFYQTSALRTYKLLTQSNFINFQYGDRIDIYADINRQYKWMGYAILNQNCQYALHDRRGNLIEDTLENTAGLVQGIEQANNALPKQLLYPACYGNPYQYFLNRANGFCYHCWREGEFVGWGALSNEGDYKIFRQDSTIVTALPCEPMQVVDGYSSNHCDRSKQSQSQSDTSSQQTIPSPQEIEQYLEAKRQAAIANNPCLPFEYNEQLENQAYCGDDFKWHFSHLDTIATQKGYKKGWIVYRLLEKWKLLTYGQWRWLAEKLGYKRKWAQIKFQQQYN